jgi:REP element-mobilizing transposase RayT
MEKKTFRNRHYNTPGHAHEITFSVYRKQNIFMDKCACEIPLEELGEARKEFSFHIWAYVVMPTYVHLLIWPVKNPYKIEYITKAIKGRMDILKDYKIIDKGISQYRIWQKGGGG